LHCFRTEDVFFSFSRHASTMTLSLPPFPCVWSSAFTVDVIVSGMLLDVAFNPPRTLFCFSTKRRLEVHHSRFGIHVEGEGRRCIAFNSFSGFGRDGLVSLALQTILTIDDELRRNGRDSSEQPVRIGENKQTKDIKIVRRVWLRQPHGPSASDETTETWLSLSTRCLTGWGEFDTIVC